MADYYTPTVVQPTIPYADMTPLEQLLLTQIFESEPDDGGLYFFAEIMPVDQFELPIETIRNALAASEGVASQAATFVIDRLKDAGGDYADIELDLSVTSWEFIFQDVVKRSATLNHVTVVSAFTCSRMRPDGFGGMAIVITADAIRGKSTGDILADFLDQAEQGAAALASAAMSCCALVKSRCARRSAISSRPMKRSRRSPLTPSRTRYPRRLPARGGADRSSGGAGFGDLQSRPGCDPRSRTAAGEPCLIVSSPLSVSPPGLPAGRFYFGVPL